VIGHEHTPRSNQACRLTERPGHVVAMVQGRVHGDDIGELGDEGNVLSVGQQRCVANLLGEDQGADRDVDPNEQFRRSA
jgi:hypothetical protein